MFLGYFSCIRVKITAFRFSVYQSDESISCTVVGALTSAAWPYGTTLITRRQCPATPPGRFSFIASYYKPLILCYAGAPYPCVVPTHFYTLKK